MAVSSVKVYVRIKKGKTSNRNMLYSDKTIQINTTLLHNKIFTFEGVFHPNVSQSELYAKAISPHVKDALAGYNCTILVYGQTATGKTYTMEGIISSKINAHCQNGIIPRSFIQIMECIHSVPCRSTIMISFFEIYNEEIIDLIGGTNSNLKLQIYENAKEEYIIKNLTKIKVQNCNQLLMYLKEGANKRQKLSTLLNKLSSRSHTIFSMWIKRRDELTGRCTNGKIDFIDLAGSENVVKSGISRGNFQETKNINKSLLALGRVIKGLNNNDKHIPFRESNLTRILKGSLNGNTKTIMIATVTTDPKNADETVKTLEYASNAQSIINKIFPNTEPGDKSIFKMNLIEDDIVKAEEEINEFKMSLGADAIELEPLLYNYDMNQKELFMIEIECEKKEEELVCSLEKENEQLMSELEKLRQVKSNLAKVEEESKKKMSSLIDFLGNGERMLKQIGHDEEESQEMVEKLQMSSYQLTKYFPLGGETGSSIVFNDAVLDELTSQTRRKLQSISDNADKLSTSSLTNITSLSEVVTSFKEKVIEEELINPHMIKNNLDELNKFVEPHDGASLPNGKI
ncbi:kinesin-like protein KLP2 isoform X2 [Cimex lectularius]|uniref:Kinesin-like protein n=1 Tax=Cimex lectularius TaxID=79782 RepID=A0A8I6THI2_CIMLE|nr:kinesin-like protein KLP2 isoform X2 [Cimex lectularius]